MLQFCFQEGILQTVLICIQVIYVIRYYAEILSFCLRSSELDRDYYERKEYESITITNCDRI